MRRFSMRALACVIIALMVVSVLPLSVAADTAVAASANSGITSNYGDVGLTVVTDEQSNLAPGVTLNEIVAYDSNGGRVEMYVTTADSNVDTVKFYANYKDNKCSNWGLQTLSEQVAAIEKNHAEPFTVVAGINASYYNTSNGKPTGAFVMEGIDVTTESEGNAYAFFAVLDDGSVMIGGKGDYSTYKDRIVEAIGGYVHIVKDGAVVSGLDKVTKYPRQTLGITEDGRVMLMTADGSQAPKTVGLTYQEQAEVMLAMGCVEAIHLDGGNSATFGGIREGTKDFVLINSPSGLAERAVSNTLCVVSTAVADGTFDRAAISGEYEFFVPNSTYTFTAKGIDASGGPAEIPADVEWTLSDTSYGTITDGTFVSNGKTGDVAIQMVYDGKVVGSRNIHIVIPTSISFDAEDKTIPYAKSASIAIAAKHNLNDVYSVADDYDFVISDDKAGTIDGFTFFATADESIKSTTVTATYKLSATLTDSVNINFGKGSDVLFDFEDGDISDWHGIDTIFDWIDEKNAANPDAKYPVSEPQDLYSNGIDKQTSNVFLASEENGGKVKNGNYSLGFTMDHKNVTDIGGWLYNYLYYTGETQVLRDVENGMNGIRIGMWVYSPDVTNTAFRLCRGTTKTDGTTGIKYSYMKSAYDEKNVSYATNYAIPEAGWIYVYYDLTDVADNIKQTTTLYDPDNNNGAKYGSSGGNYYPAFLQLFTGSATDTPQTVTYYIDDITIDYSDVTDDRNAPTITDTKVSANVDNFVALNGQTVNNNCLSFEATVADVENSNATGLDYTTAKIYVDGIDVSDKSTFKCAGKTIALSDVYVNNGKHNITFEIADKQGNVTRVTKELTVAGETDAPVVSIAGRNESGATPKAGSVYYADINTTDAAKTKSVKTVLKLDLSNSFEYENIVLAPGVEAEYEYNELDRELTLTLTNNGTLTGAQTLASVPIRVWAWDEATTGVTADKQFATGAIPTINIELKSVYGSVTYTDGTIDKNYICGVSGAFDVATELDNKTAWHKHTAVAVADVAATCTESGYEGRTYCDGCKSIVDWGTTIKATGHNFVVEDGKIGCSNCEATDTMTGLFETEEGVYYFIAGVVQTGWHFIGSDWYYFDTTTAIGIDGTHKLGQVTYDFTNGKMDSGVWVKTLYGTRYYFGPTPVRTGWFEIEGKWYNFEDYYQVSGGYQVVIDNIVYPTIYYFKEDGSCDRDAVIPDGFYTDRNGLAYVKNGKIAMGLQNIDGVNYYFGAKGYAITGEYAGYLFGDDYKAVSGLIERNGVLCYYENGKPKMAGLIEVDGDLYFAGGSKGQVATGTTYVWEGNGILPNGTYTFGADGKILQGIINDNGTIRYYKNGQPKMAGLVEVDGDIYFAYGSKGEVATDTMYVWEGNGILPEGTYKFGADGKLYQGVVNDNGVYRYYVNGQPKMAGLVEVDGDYYFASGSKGEVAIGTQYVWQGNGLLPNATYKFGEDGKMLQGIVYEDGVIRYYVNGQYKMAGLVEVDGDYYFAGGSKGECSVGTQYVWQGNGILPNGTYKFGEDGKMLQGIVEEDGVLRYYVNGQFKMAGLIEIDGDYYFAGGSKGEITVNQVYYVWETNGLMPNDTYEFGADGKMLDGIVNKDGKLYYYETGKPKMAGLVEIDGDYYFAGGSKGEISIGKTYVWEGNNILPEDNYYFAEDGKMIDGFVTEDGVLKYYENGKFGKIGLHYIDGYYYFIDYGAKVIVNQSYYVWETNGYTIPMTYRFDAQGRVVL